MTEETREIFQSFRLALVQIEAWLEDGYTLVFAVQGTKRPVFPLRGQQWTEIEKREIAAKHWEAARVLRNRAFNLLSGAAIGHLATATRQKRAILTNPPEEFIVSTLLNGKLL